MRIILNKKKRIYKFKQLCFFIQLVKMDGESNYDNLPEHVLEKVFCRVRDTTDKLSLFLVSKNWNFVARRVVTFNKFVHILSAAIDVPNIPDRKFTRFEIDGPNDPIVGEFLLSRKKDIQALVMRCHRQLSCDSVLELTEKLPRIGYLGIGNKTPHINNDFIYKYPRFRYPNFYAAAATHMKTLRTNHIDFIPTTAIREQKFERVEMCVEDFPTGWICSEFVLHFSLGYHNYTRLFYQSQFDFVNLVSLELRNATINNAQLLATAYPCLERLTLLSCTIDFKEACTFHKLKCWGMHYCDLLGDHFISAPTLNVLNIWGSYSVLGMTSFDVAIKFADTLTHLTLTFTKMYYPVWDKLFQTVAVCGAVLDLFVTTSDEGRAKQLTDMGTKIKRLCLNKQL